MKMIFKPLSKEIKDAFKVDCNQNTRLTIGRKDSNDVILPFRNVSSFHAIVECVDGIVYIEDLNSTNGTFINGEKVEGRVVVKKGDTVRFATYDFLVDIEEEKNKEKTSEKTSSDGTVFLDSQKIKEVQSAISKVKSDDSKQEEKGKETVLYGVKGLVQNGRLILLDKNNKFLNEYELKETETSIGRDDTNTISIDHGSISRVHCFVNRKDDYYEIADNDSTNGVLVNGKKVKKAILKNGDIVKLGDKKFVFIAPGELFSPSLFEGEKEKTSLKFDRKKVYIGIGVFFLVLIVILALIPSGEKKVARRQSVSVKDLKLDVMNSFKNEDWDNVVYLVDNFKLKGFEKEYEKAKFEIKNRDTYLKFVDLLKNENFEEAKNVMESMDKSSVYFAKAQKNYEDKSEEFINSKLEEIDSYLDENKVNDAYEQVCALAEKFPDNQKVLQAKDEVEQKFQLFTKKKQARQRYYALRMKLKRKSSAFEKQAENLYLDGKVVDAIAKIIDARQVYIAKNMKVPSRIDRLKDYMGKVRKLYLDGKKEIMQGKTESAAEKFEKIFDISQKYLWGKEGKIERECKTLLKDYYKNMARKFYSSNNYTKALTFADKVIQIEPSDREMASLKREILKTAKGLYNKGYIEQTQYKDCKAALFYFRQVVEILPPSDPVYKKAMKRIEECEK